MNTPAHSLKSPEDNNQQKLVGNRLRVFADFNNADEQDCLRLNCIGTIDDLARQKIELKDGQSLTFYSEDLEVDGIVKYSEEENIWVAVIDWNNIRQTEEIKVSERKLLEFLEKLTYTSQVLGKVENTSKPDDKSLIQNELEPLLDEMKDDLKYAHAGLTHDQEISDHEFYNQFVGTFGKEEADEVWAARQWNTKLVLKDFLLILMDEPELRQRIENRGVNFDEYIALISQQEQVKESETATQQIDKQAMDRLIELVCFR
ncbi:hypothetical protein VB638_06245 [Dolichospermum sp. UHCC 0684]|jgi:hypothetical protein|uniref:Uncharacterized protein n=1 Tax=Dolichospermum heterosporum TAC447 TaxID=747523 RepID=A0ABY5LTQ8_9CYAN|nr:MULTISPECIES: hypothetical protein [Aphanizomenonaceae]MDK2409204.1 hypothetical protein [Aphanizomenon sp. 202]MDK2460681.1 hypothetical protein [Aphanizomenon sp. PH219]MEA5529193.1 hypothetical protein [Dolichospermum sp. UHCC 0684]UUO13933.1 hypothetical protein NG743_17990 [Dolichospermum heterosporum TAC447]